jgi:tRNA threonylcarbamoyladenosine biosynthesis protein TsaB
VITLALDASTYTGDVCLLDATRVLAEESVAMRGVHEERLMPAVAGVLARAGLGIHGIERVVCGSGPGSFTSLRIAGSIAKGIALGIGCPLFSVSSLALMIGGAQLRAGRYLAALDAMRGEFYVALYDVAGDRSVNEIERARLVRGEDVELLAGSSSARIVSPSPFADSVTATPRARAVATLATSVDARGEVDLARWEPSYGRLAEAQVKWEAAHGRPLPVG